MNVMPMETNMKGSSKTIKPLARECTSGAMERFMMVSGSTE